jgi:hypothetical protein
MKIHATASDLPFPNCCAGGSKRPVTKSPCGKRISAAGTATPGMTITTMSAKSPWGCKSSGCKKSDAIALIGDNIPEMLFTAIGAQAIGGISAAIYQTTMPEEIAQLLDYLKVSPWSFATTRSRWTRLSRSGTGPGRQKSDLRRPPRHARATGPTTGSCSSKDLYRLGR